MKKIIYLCVYLFMCLFIYSCKAQTTIIDFKDRDVIVFSNKTKDIRPDALIYYENDSFFILHRYRARYNYDREYHEDDSLFFQGKDTMNIRCHCGQGRNYYFKNLEFKKGKYELTFNFGKKYNEQLKRYEHVRPIILGSQIQTPKKVQDILFKNAYYNPWEEPIQKDRYFKELQFMEIDFKDTLHVKLKKVDKFRFE